MTAEFQCMDEHDNTDAMALEYANIHQLDELVDSLICKVAEKKPENAKEFMAHFLKTRLRNVKKFNNAEITETDFMKLQYTPESCHSITTTSTRATVSTTTTSSPVVSNRNLSREPSVLSTETESIASNFASDKSMPAERVTLSKKCDSRKSVGCNGVWQYLRSSVIPSIVIQVRELATYENVMEQLPPQFIATLHNVIEVLARASECIPESVFIAIDKANATAIAKKVDRCLQELRLPPHQQMQKAFELLKEVILNNTPLATYSQQRHLSCLISYVCYQVQNGKCVQIEKLFCDVWRTVRDSATRWNEIVRFTCGEMFIFDPLLVLDVDALKMCVYLLDELAAVLPNWEQAHMCISDALYNNQDKENKVKMGSFYERLLCCLKETCLCETCNIVSCEIADKFVIYATLLTRCVEETVGTENFTAAHACAFYGIIRRSACIMCTVIESRENVCNETLMTNTEHRVSNNSLFDNLIATCRSFFGKRCALIIARRSNKEVARVDESGEVEDSFASYLYAYLPSLQNCNEMCQAFVRVASYIITHPFDGSSGSSSNSSGRSGGSSSSSSRLESVFMNAKVLLSMLLLRLCIVIIYLRNDITLSEIRKFSGRFLFYGIPISDMYMFFQRTFTLVIDKLGKRASEPEVEHKLALQMLKMLESAFANSNSTQYLRKAKKSLELLQKGAKFDELSASYLSHACCETHISPSTLAQSIGFSELLKAIVQTLTNEQSESLMCENVVKLHTFLSARLLLYRYKPQKFWSIVTTVLLANCSVLEERIATFSLLLPAIEIIGALNPAVGIGAELKNSDQDQFMLLSFFQSCKLPRVLHWSMESFICTFPSYRARILHLNFAYEVETELANCLLTLCRSTDEEAELVLKYWSTKMALYGVKMQDLVLFGISLTSQLRRPSFPEFEWVLFYNNIIDELQKRTASISALSNYATDEDLRKIKCIQTNVRRFLQHRKDKALSHSNYNLLEKRLQELPTLTCSESCARKNEYEPTKITSNLINSKYRQTCLFTTEKRQLVQLSWRSLKLDAQILTMYKAIVNANTFDLNTHSFYHDMFDVSELKRHTQPMYEHSAMYVLQQESESARTRTNMPGINRDAIGDNSVNNNAYSVNTATSSGNVNANGKENNNSNNTTISTAKKVSSSTNNKNTVVGEPEGVKVNGNVDVSNSNKLPNEGDERIPVEARLTSRKASRSDPSEEASLFSSPSSLRRSRETQRNLMSKCEVIVKNMSSLIELLLEEPQDSYQKFNKEHVSKSQTDVNQTNMLDRTNNLFPSTLSASMESNRIRNTNISNF